MVERPGLFTIPRKSVGIGVSLAILVALLAVVYHIVPTSYQSTIVFFGAGLAAAGAIAGAFYTGHILEFYLKHEKGARQEALVQAEASRADRLKREEHERQEMAFRYGERWNDPAMFHTRNVCRDIIAKRKNPEAIKEELLADDTKRTNANHLLNFFDELALSVRVKRADGEISKRQFGGLAVHLYRAMSAYRDHWVNEIGREDAWAEFKWLYDQWTTPKIEGKKGITP